MPLLRNLHFFTFINLHRRKIVQTRTFFFTFLDNLLENKSNEVKTYVKSQLFHKEKSHWSENEKQLALQLFYKSPASYKEMIKMGLGFTLPSISTIQKWHSVIRFNTGLSETIKQMLRKKNQIFQLKIDVAFYYLTKCLTKPN